jgi:hypothetical protein
MGTTPTSSAMVSGLPFYVWEVPEKQISIQLHFDVIDRMSPDILRGLGALKRRGAEVGGILLGRSESGPRRKVIVEDFELAPTEYLNGPSYNLSENDLIGFEAAIARRQCEPESGLSVVGFYRSHTRDALYMDDADLELASRYFPGPENVFLLIKPFASRPSVAGFFFWEDGEINRESSYLQFPFHRQELGGGEPRPAPPLRRQEPEDRPLPAFRPEAELEAGRQVPAEEYRPGARPPGLSILSAPKELKGLPDTAGSHGWRWLLVPAFLGIAGVAGFFAYQNLNNSKTPPGPVTAETALPLKLSVSEKQNQLDVTWDRNAPAIARARRGVLSISDGANRRDLELSGAQLRNGRVLYSRLSGDVNLRLEVFPEGQASVNESIRIVSTEAPPMLPELPRKLPENSRASEAEYSLANTPVEKRAVEKPRRLKPALPSSPRAESAPQPPVAQPEPPPEVELQRPARRR